VTVRRLVATLGLALAALGIPMTASAQSYCGGGNGGYSLYSPVGYSAYGGFASYPGGFTSGAVPNNYSSNLYNGCASAGSAASQPYTYTGNTYNPYSTYAAAGSGTYGYNQAITAGAYGGYGAGSTSPSVYGGYDPSGASAYGSQSAPGTNPAYGTPASYGSGSGYGTAPSYGSSSATSPSYGSGYGTSYGSTSGYGAPSYGSTAGYNSSGYGASNTGYNYAVSAPSGSSNYTSTPSWTSSYTGFASYPGGISSGYGVAPTSSAYGANNYGASPTNPLPTTMLTWGR